MSSKIYIGTKAFALRGTLLDRGAIQKLAESTSLEELVNRLRSTPYADSLSGMTPPFTARRLELAFRDRAAEVVHSMMTSAANFRILGLYYLKQVAWDLKIALKSKALNRTYEETVEFMDMKAEELVGRRDLIVKVLSARDVNEAVSLLSGTEFFGDVERALAAFTSKGEVRFFDLYIDHAVLSAISKEYSANFRTYASPRATDVAGVGEIVAGDIDAYNVLGVLRSKLWGHQEAETRALVITPTHRVSSQLLSRMIAAESTSEAVKLLEQIYAVSTQNAQSDEQLIDAVEDAFIEDTRQTAAKAFVWQGLSPGSALALVKLLEFEVGNLAAVAIGVEAGMETKSVLAKLRI